ncbi:GSCFA domain-containing protein [Olleya sp. YS]|uniref:GSCFA domain-containing protein n=1 Tax=Olleya sp. YS TaxID=3028318 RepID=UPI00243460BE|nr:GSCFA domain-containing protein [Olleya sp. YS]WGD33672.1 GSCFA domain-containing protein [Olleya sp. YS]
MEFQTEIKLKKQEDNQIDYHSKVLLLGSCFSENIGETFEYYKFQNYINPFGVLFHPKAIETLVSNALNGKKYTENDIFLNNEQFHCYDAHSRISNPTKSLVLHQLNAALQKTNHYLKHATHVVITLGTAWVYRLQDTKQIVANCHKMPQKQFDKTLLSVDDILLSLQVITNQIEKVNPNVNIIFTVSPVRHVKDGFVENTQSKSHLITAIHQFLHRQSSIKNHKSYYFPAFEIMMDQLRDYRFYKEDMIHPNAIAIQFIWERFKEVWISKSAEETIEDVTYIQKGIQHKPFNPKSEAHLKFIEQLESKKQLLAIKFPQIKFD